MGQSQRPPDIPPSKISCLACRASKRRCDTPDTQTTCRRCVSQKLVCEYKQHNRGNKRKRSSPSQSSPGLHTTTADSRQLPRLNNVMPQRQTPTARLSEWSERPSAHTHPASLRLSMCRRQSSIDTDTALPSIIDGDVLDLFSDCDVSELFAYYFAHLNRGICVLDPVLHTASVCASRSTLLFTTVLTVTAKVIRPHQYASCLRQANRLLGQAMESGLLAIEVIQAIIILTHWRKVDDQSAYRRIGYAVRMAYELKLNVRGPRPLPTEEQAAREVLNPERTWLSLVVADYHMSIHLSLPRMVVDDGEDDPAEWGIDACPYACPGQSTLIPWLFNPSSLTVHSLLEADWRRWRGKWLLRAAENGFDDAQVSVIKVFDSLFNFHLREYRLFYALQPSSSQHVSDTADATEMAIAFTQCVDAALAIGDVFQSDFVEHDHLPYCFNLVWVALVISMVWLVRNMSAMSPELRVRALSTLTSIHTATERATRSNDDMAAYLFRLSKHMLDGTSSGDRALAASQADAASMDPAGLAPEWTVMSTSQIIHDHLWRHVPVPAPQPHISPLSTQLPPLADTQVPVPLLETLFPAPDDDIWRLLIPDNGQFGQLAL